MVKQRRESARAYEEGGRLELAEQEREEIEVIEEFLPRPLDPTAQSEAVNKRGEPILDASSIRDMGRVMALLKERYTGQDGFRRRRADGQGPPVGALSRRAGHSIGAVAAMRVINSPSTG